MLERLKRGAPAVLVAVLALTAPPAVLAAEPGDPVAPAAADIELRKSFRPVPRAGRQTSRPGSGQDGGGRLAAPGDPVGVSLQQVGAAVEALGESLQSSGTLYLPGVGESGAVLDGATTPLLETASGRRLIVDPGRTITPDTAADISRLWPDFTVFQPAAAGSLRETIGSMLESAGYFSVARSAPLTFGPSVTVRITPDFVVLRNDRDLLEGEMRAISVVDPADAIPAELRELAGAHRVKIVEMTRDGEPAGWDRAPWRDAAGRVTTVASGRLATLLTEVAGALGLETEQRVVLPARPGEPLLGAELRISDGRRSALVLETPDPRRRDEIRRGGETAIEVAGPADLPAAIGAILGHFQIPAIGPTVEFYRAPVQAAAPRFGIRVPGWLVESGERRTLVTGAALPTLIRLYLTREGIDILEYRVR